jgi:predicted ester cyclase
MSTEENKAVVRRGIEEVWNQKNVAIVDEIAAPDYVSHNPAMTTHGLEQYKQLVMMYFTAFPDIHLTIEDEIAEGDKVVTRVTAFMGIPPTGKQAVVTGIVIDRFANGKTVEAWNNLDDLGLLQQLGVIPTPR